MTMMLASVTGPDEAEIAIAGGADIVDLKDPAAGALGALPAARIAATIGAIKGRRPVSAVTGDLPPQPDIVASAVRDIATTGVDYVKVGFPGDRRSDVLRILAGVAVGARLVGVVFADRERDLAELNPGRRGGLCRPRWSRPPAKARAGSW